MLQLATPITRLSVMEGRTLAIGAFRTRLDDDFNIIAAIAFKHCACHQTPNPPKPVNTNP